MATRQLSPVVAREQQLVRPGHESAWDDAEQLLLEFFATGPAGSGSNRRHLLRLPRRVLRALGAVRSLPVLRAELSSSGEGQVIREGLAHLVRRTRKTAFVRTPLHEVASVLILPSTPHQYALGSSKQTARRKSRAAQRAGVRWSTVDDPAERLRLIALSEARERNHPQARYRSADVDNSDLRDLGLWLVARSPEGVPLLVAVVPVDGEWAILKYFRTLEDSPAASNARYLMSCVLVDQLVERGVRYLADTATMSNLPDGLRHFQRMLGYRVVRLRLSAAGRSASQMVTADTAPSPAPERRSTPVSRRTATSGRTGLL